MDIAGRDVRIRDEIVFGIHRPVVEIEKALGFLVSHEKATIWIGHTFTGYRRFGFGNRPNRLRLQGFFP